jgi:hypothetical protein
VVTQFCLEHVWRLEQYGRTPSARTIRSSPISSAACRSRAAGRAEGERIVEADQLRRQGLLEQLTASLRGVLTDGESVPVGPKLARLSGAGIRTSFVHLWEGDELIWRPKGAEPQYRPDPSSRRVLARAAALVDGATFSEQQADDIVRWARRELGEGPTRLREQRDLFALMRT